VAVHQASAVVGISPSDKPTDLHCFWSVGQYQCDTSPTHSHQATYPAAVVGMVNNPAKIGLPRLSIRPKCLILVWLTAFSCWLDYCNICCMLVVEIPSQVFGQFRRSSSSRLVVETVLASSEKLPNAWRLPNLNHISHQMWCRVQLITERTGLENGIVLVKPFSSKQQAGGRTLPLTAGSWSRHLQPH